MPDNKFYITTSIAYTNANPHLGFALELVQADVLARYNSLLSKDVFFSTGTDEHGVKIVKAAERAGKSSKEFVDEIAGKFEQLAKSLNISNTSFIRTTDQKFHWPVVKKVWQKLKENGDIYKKEYEGLYCVGCEAFITKKDLVNGKCEIHNCEPEIIKEENYFFKLSKYRDQVRKAIETDKIKIIPDGRRNEVLSFLNQEAQDISFSRPRKDLQWGIPVPDDDTQTIYVWADALTNYLSVIDYENESENFKKYWPADVHCIGKDILKFHAVIWPAMLLSLGLALPQSILVHGYLTVGGQKMSKSLGNVVDPFELIAKYGADAVRYFLLREIPSTEDGDFTEEKFVKRYNSDLAGGLGNLVARTITLATKADIKPENLSSDFQIITNKTKTGCKKSLEEFKFNDALAVIWELISFCDEYIEKEQPWKESENKKEVIGNLLLSLSEMAGLIKPFLPETSEKINKQLQSLKSEPIFPRV